MIIQTKLVIRDSKCQELDTSTVLCMGVPKLPHGTQKEVLKSVE